jgi:hypothetical protein
LPTFEELFKEKADEVSEDKSLLQRKLLNLHLHSLLNLVNRKKKLTRMSSVWLKEDE